MNKEVDLKKLKSALRDHYKVVMRNVSEKRRYEAKLDLFDFLKPKIDLSNKVLSFVSFRDEIDSSLINEYLISEKKLHLPMLKNDEIVHEVEYDLILVPGLAFDNEGVRLGRGKGHFDKFLLHYKDAKKMGICFKEQLSTNNLPKEIHDVKVDDVCAF